MKSNLAVIGAALFLCAAAFAESPFSGTWKPNGEKMQRFDFSSIKIESDGKDGIRYEQRFSLIWLSRLEFPFLWTPLYAGPLDGLKRPDDSRKGNDVIPQKTGERSFSLTSSQEGRDMLRVDFSVSADGRALTEHMTWLYAKPGQQEGSTNTFKRIGGEGKPYAFLGEWKADPEHSRTKPPVMTISETGGILTLSWAQSPTKIFIDLNRSAVSSNTEKVAPGTKTFAKRLVERSIEYTLTRDGMSRRLVLEAGEDGKTLTVHETDTTQEGKTFTATAVFERQ